MHNTVSVCQYMTVQWLTCKFTIGHCEVLVHILTQSGTIQMLNLLITASICTVIVGNQAIKGAQAGFLLSFAMETVEGIEFLMYKLRNFEVQGVSLERMDEYEQLEPELGSDTGLSLPVQAILCGLEEREWPKEGNISVHNLCVKYGDNLPEILHNISFEVQAGERVGIVGSTGGGKSTLAKAFFRFLDITTGTIAIDNQGEFMSLHLIMELSDLFLDIMNLPLGMVRSNIGIIAQDPVLLSGTLRLNLDIEGHYTDDQLYHTLATVQLIKTVQPQNGSNHGSASAIVDLTTSSDQVNSNGADVPGSCIFENLDLEIVQGGGK